jgi:hypothetical protein
MTFAQAVKELAMTRPTTKEPVGAQFLIEILKDDVILAVERPGSWEGANMLQVLTCHGFFNQD